MFILLLIAGVFAIAIAAVLILASTKADSFSVQPRQW